MRYCSQLKASERRVLYVMKNKNIKWIITIIITISLCAAVFGTIVSADNVLYVNPNGETISSLKGLYVLGGSGTAGALTANSVWAMTASGLENIGGDGSGTEAKPKENFKARKKNPELITEVKELKLCFYTLALRGEATLIEDKFRQKLRTSNLYKFSKTCRVL